MPVIWDSIRHFKSEEFACACCGREEMQHAFVVSLDRMRDEAGFPLIINSGYRCPRHNAAVSGSGLDGPHTTGRAADIGASYHRARILLALSVKYFRGIGIKQHGTAAGRFVHVDSLSERVWTYD